MEEKKTPEQKKKNPLQKLKEGVDDKEEQLVILSTFVRLGVVVWSGFIISLNYITLPAFGKQPPKDITFVASVFTGALASFGLQTASKKGDGTYKADEEKKKAEAANGSVTTVRFETGVRIIPDKPRVDQLTGKKIDPETGKLT
mgnify:CR=1 FL=1